MTIMPLTPPAESLLELEFKNDLVKDDLCMKKGARKEDLYPCPWIETPLIESAPLSKLAGCRIFLKMENFQPSGSFKSRGIGNLVRCAVARNTSSLPLHFYASSGGNAGLACVTAATSLKQRSTVVVPITTNPGIIKLILAAGAGLTKVIQFGKTIADSDEYIRLNLLPNDPRGIHVPPFDHMDIWNGAETLTHEVHDQLNGELPDSIVCSVGGGGLLIGICQGLERISQTNSTLNPMSKLASRSAHKTQVVGVETIGCESFSQAIKAKSLVTLPGITSIATSLGCTRVASRALEYGLKSNVHSTLVTDREAIEACIRFAEDHKVLVEPACGTTLALVYSGRLKEVLPQIDEDSKMVLVVCGGSIVSIDLLCKWKIEYGL